MNFPELISGGDFETGAITDHWTPWGALTFEKSTVQKHGGTYSAHFADSTGLAGFFTKTLFSIETGRPYLLDFWYFLVSGRIGVGLTVNANFHSLDVIGAWTNALIEITPIFLTAYEGVFFNGLGSGLVEYYIDDISFKRLPFIPAQLAVNFPGFGHGPFGHIPFGHGTVIVPKEDE